MLAHFAALLAVAAPQPARDPGVLHKNVAALTAEKEATQEAVLRKMLQLGGSAAEEAEVLARLAGTLRARGVQLMIAAQAEQDAGDTAGAERDRKLAEAARSEAIARYRERLSKFPAAARTDEALFFLADALEDSGKPDEAEASARELVKRFPRSAYAPASHVYIGERLFDAAKLDEALAQYRAAAEAPADDVYPYALYKAAWCRFNQSRFDDAMKLLARVVAVSEKRGNQNAIQLAREARRDYVLSYSHVGKVEEAQAHFAAKFGAQAGLKMLEQFAKLLFDTGRDPDAQLVSRELLALHGDAPGAALDQTRLVVLAQRGGKRSELLAEANHLVTTLQRVRKGAKPDEEVLQEAERLGEETLRNLAVQIHNEARKTDLDDTWNAARAMYGDYLALFPDAPDAYDLRFFDGELLYARGEKPAAAERYEEVVRIDLGKKQPGKWLAKAAWSAVLARSESLPDAGKAQQGTHEDARKLSTDEEKLAASCALYLKALPDGPHAVEVSFKLGRLEYLSSKLDEAEKHLAWIATQHPEHELAEYAANLVLDIQNLRKDYAGLHAWALRFLSDRKLLAAHKTLATDLARIEEESAYALADAQPDDAAKARALLDFAAAHPRGQLADKALFGASAALSRSGDIDGALAARQRVWKETPQSPLVPRALLASASDLAAVADVSEAAALLEKYVAGYQHEQALKKWRAQHRPAHPPKVPFVYGYDEAKAQAALHDAIVLREAHGDLSRAAQDRQQSLNLWPDAQDKIAQQIAIADLHARAGENSRAARELAGLAKQAKTPGEQIVAWEKAAKLFARVREAGNASWSWNEVERIWRGLGPKGREKLSDDAQLAEAEAHFALGSEAFERFARQEIKAPLMWNLNRKIALLQAVKKRAEETVALHEAEPAVCALAQLGEAQMQLARALAESPYPPGLNGEQRKLYRAALQEKAQPIIDEARDTLENADGKAHELGVVSPCASKVASLLGKAGGAPEDRETIALAAQPVLPPPEYVAATEVEGERRKRVLEEALEAAQRLEPREAAQRLAAAAQAEPSPPAQLDAAIALELAGQPADALKLYAQAAQSESAVAVRAAERGAWLAAARGDADGARALVAAAETAAPDAVEPVILRAEIELALGDVETARDAAREALSEKPLDVRALSAMARAQLALGQPGTAKLLLARAGAKESEPLVVKAEIARAENQPALELAAAKAAVQLDPDSPAAQLELGRALLERGQLDEAVAALEDAAGLDPSSYAVALALGEGLAASGDSDAARAQLSAAVSLAPAMAEPHYQLARLALDEDDDAQTALNEAKLFLNLSTPPPPASHPVHALLTKCEGRLKERAQASILH